MTEEDQNKAQTMPHFRMKFLLITVVLFHLFILCTADEAATQAQVLKQFRDENDDEIEHWQGNDPCDYWSGIVCSESGEITSIEYKYRSQDTLLYTSIPPQFSLLKQLKKIIFDEAGVTGIIPPELSTLKFMEEFSMNLHEMSGTIPPELSTWKNIKIVDLEPLNYYDSFTGTLPPEFSEWGSLEKLNLYNNEDLSGTLPIQYSTWYNIFNISLYDNGLVGTLPVQYSTWANIQYISLQLNTLSGTLPMQYSTWVTVSHVSFKDNAINGTLPVQFSTWGNVSYVSFEDNYLTGAVPIQYSKWSNFTKLMLYQDTYYDDSLCITDYLVGLFLQKDNINIYKQPGNPYDINDDTGYDYDTTIDSKKSDVLSLRTCLSFNPEAEALQQFKNSLDDESLLSSWQGDDPCNQWRGITCTDNKVTTIEYTDGCCEDPTIPPQFSNLKFLKKISIGDADLQGTIPPELSILEDMEVFQIQNHELLSRATIPRELSTWRNLQIFDVEADDYVYFIGGVLPVEFSEWRELRVFNIKNNIINGSLPIQYSTWVNIQYLSVQDNGLVGTLPVQYSTWVDVQYLNFSNNNIIGSVPYQYSFWNIPTILYLHPQKQNNLCISDYFAGYLTSKKKNLNTDVDKLAVCSILPNTSSNIEANALLQFGNSVQDQSLLPSWRGDNPCNKWRGITCTQKNNVSTIEYTYPQDAVTSIPPEFSTLKYLKNIIFNRDGITGTIPPELSVLDIVEFEIYEQKMKGTLPVQLSTWKNIQTFNLKGLTDVGQLTGPLPQQFSTWTNINYFDVGNNALSGTLPVQLSTWHNVSYVDLSGNNFTGRVPEGYSNIQADLYLADQNLRGLCVSIKLADFFLAEISSNDIDQVPICSS